MKNSFLFIILTMLLFLIGTDNHTMNNVPDIIEKNIKALASETETNEACESSSKDKCVEWIVRTGDIAGPIYYPGYKNKSTIVE